MKKQVLIITVLLAAVSIVAGCGGGGGGGFFSPGPTAKPGAFILVAPVNNENASLTPTLTWTASSQAASYTMDISSSATFTPIVFTATVTPPRTNVSLTAGTVTAPNTYYWRVMASNSLGTTLATAGTGTFTVAAAGGSVEWATVSDPTGTDAEAFAIALDSGPTKTWMYFVGYDTNTGINQDDQWRIEKRKLSDGTLDPTFGVKIINPSIGYDDAYSVVTTTDALYVVGVDQAGTSGKDRWRIEKRSLDTGNYIGFGTVNSAETGTSDAYSSATDGSSLYVVGFDTDVNGIEEWRFEKFDLTTGASQTVVTSATGIIGHVSNEANAVVYDAGNLYIAGYDSLTTTAKWRLEKRGTDGSIAAGFGDGGTGVVSATTFTFAGYASALATGPSQTGLIIAGADTTTNNKWRLAKIDKSNGSLDTAFGTGGFITYDVAPGWAEPFAVTVVGDSIYVAGYEDTLAGTAAWRIEKRDFFTGILDVSFGNGGAVTYDPSTGEDIIYAIAADGAGLYLAGRDVDSNNHFEWRMEKRTP